MKLSLKKKSPLEFTWKAPNYKKKLSEFEIDQIEVSLSSFHTVVEL